MSSFRRWLRFNAVGIAGAAVQLTSLFALVELFGIHYLLGTLLAVEAAIVHNFCWHLRWTWRDRPTRCLTQLGTRLVRFHVANGLVSLFGNAALMALFVGELGLPALIANGGAIVCCSILNFLLSHHFVFRPEPPV